MLWEIHIQELVNLVENRLELGNALEGLLDCLELGAELLDGLPLNSMEVTTLDQLGQRSIELNHVCHLEQECEEDYSNWHNENHGKNTFQ